MFYLFDMLNNSHVGIFNTIDEAAEAVGAAMNLLGLDQCKNRFYLTKRPRHHQAEVVLGQQELFSRALVYYQPKIRPSILL